MRLLKAAGLGGRGGQAGGAMAAEAVAAETGFAEFGILGPLEVRRSGRAVPPYVSHLRPALEPDRSRGAAGGVLVTRNRPVMADRTTSRSSRRA